MRAGLRLRFPWFIEARGSLSEVPEGEGLREEGTGGAHPGGGASAASGHGL